MTYTPRQDDGPAAMERASDALEYVDAHDRDTWLRMAMALKSEFGEAGFSVWDDWSQTADNYNQHDSMTVWRGIKSGGGVGIGSLFHESRENGWRDDVTYTVESMTPEQVEERRQARLKKTAEAEEQVRHEQAQAARWTAEIWKRAEPVVVNQYLDRKQVSPTSTLRQIDVSAINEIIGYPLKSKGEPLTGAVLVAPMRRAGSSGLCSTEIIDGTGRKTALAGRGTKSGAYWATERLDNPTVLLVGEGVATVMSASQAVNLPGVAALSCGNMKAVALAMREMHPAAKIVLLADLKKDTGAPDEKAAEAAKLVGGCLAVPDFGTGREPGQTDFNDLHVLKGLDAVRASIEAARSEAAKPRLRALRRDDLIAAPDIDWTIKGVMPARGVGVVFGQSTVGKSFLEVDKAAALAEARDWFGCRVKQRPVVYACLEGQHGFKRRVMAWEAHHGRQYPDGVIFAPDPIDLRSERDTAALIELATREAGSGAVVIIDTLNRAAPGMEENGSVDYGLILASAARIEQAVEGFVCFVGHPGKDASKGLRGHYSMFAGLDMVLEVEEVNKAELSFAWITRKVKDGQDGIKRHFRREVVELFEDADGDLVTSCVIVPDPETDGEAKAAKTANISRTNRERFEGFRQAAMEHGTIDDAGQFIGLDKEQWRTHFFEHSPAPNNPAKRSAHNTTIKELKKVGLIYERSDGLFQFDGLGAETQSEVIRAAIEERSRGKNHGQAEERRERRDPKKSEESSLAKDREAKRREDPPLRDLRSSHELGQFQAGCEGEEKPDRRKSEPPSHGTSQLVEGII